MTTKSAKFDWNGVGRFALLGGTVGAGAALLRALSRHLASIQDTGSSKQYLPLKIAPPAEEEPTIKAAAGETAQPSFFGGTASDSGPPSLWAYLLGIPAAYLTGVGAYKGVSKVYDKFQERELGGELEQAQQDYLNSLHQEKKMLMDKKANVFSENGRPYGLSDTALAVLLGAIPLGGYASHVLTKRYLERAFPEPKSQFQDVLPVRLEADDRAEKVASGAGSDVRAWHLAGRIVMEHTKGASLLDSLVDAAAEGKLQAVEDVACDFSFDKAASVAELADQERQARKPVAARSIALHMLLKSASLGEPVRTIIAAELHDMAPTVKVAHFMGTDTERELLEIGGIMGSIGMLADLMTVKEARESMMSDPGAIKLKDDGTDSREISEQLQAALDQFGSDQGPQYTGAPDDALVSLLTFGQGATDSRGDKVDVEGAAMPVRDEVDEFFEALPKAGVDKRPQTIHPQTSGVADGNQSGQSGTGSADYRTAG